MPAKDKASGKSLGVAAALGLGLLAAACGTDEGPRFACPQAILVEDAAQLVRFEGPGRDLTDVDFEAEIQAPAIGCSFDEEEFAVVGDMQLRIVASRGPADNDRTARFEYFVAVATAVGRRIIAREEFGLSVPFEGNRTRVVVVEELSPRIPIRADETGAEYRLYVGFKLSPEELDYNRKAR